MPLRRNLELMLERGQDSPLLRFSLGQECLDHFILCGERHVDCLVSEYVDYYHSERCHQSKDNLPLVGNWPEASGEPRPPGKIVCQQRLGGLLKSYARRAA